MNDINHQISDIRSLQDFKGVAFSGYKKGDVFKELNKALKEGRVEPACYWSAELICAGHLLDLWEVILGFASKTIHTANPLLFPYLELRLTSFLECIREKYVDNELGVRNNAFMRELFAEMIATLAFSKKTYTVDSVKIKSHSEFDMLNIASKLKAPNMTFAGAFMNPDDAQEVLVAINELVYHLSEESSNAMMACYWLEWIIAFDSLCRTKKQPLVCKQRQLGDINPKHYVDVIWLVWEIFIKKSKSKSPTIVSKVMSSLCTLFCVRYGSGVKRKRKSLLYMAIHLLTTKMDFGTAISNNKVEISAVVRDINKIYYQIKKSEKSPPVDPVFGAQMKDRTSKERSEEKLKIMRQIDSDQGWR